MDQWKGRDGYSKGILAVVSSERFEWYYMGATGEIGPLSESQLLDLADHAALKRDTLVWKVGMEAWAAAESIPMIASRLKPTWSPPPAPGLKPPPVQATPPKLSLVVCPKDGSQLEHASRSGIEIEYCPKCRGVWLDRGELDKLVERESKDDRRRYRDDDDDDGRRRGGRFREIFDLFD